MRILFASTRAAGHFGPLIPFAHACRRAGHDVLVAAPGQLAPHADRAGLPHAPLADPRDDVLAPLWARLKSIDDEHTANQIALTEIFAGEHARRALPGMLTTMRRWRPDVVVRETAEFSSIAAAEALGIPHVHVAIFLAMELSFDWGALAAPMDALRAMAGLRPDPHPERHWDAPCLTLAPRSLEDPLTAPHPETRRFRERARTAQPLPGRWPTDDPLLYVSFGSVAAGAGFYPGLYRAVVDGLEGLPARVLLTVGTDVDPADLGPVPASVHVERWVPQAAVMPHAAAMIGHGGSGSTLMAMAAGVPVALIPMFADQPANARRIAALGAGLALGPVMEGEPARSLAGPDAAARIGDLRDAAIRLLDEPVYRDTARALAAEIGAHAPVEAAPALLADVARGDALAA